jgi:hypothetical protein
MRLSVMAGAVTLAAIAALSISGRADAWADQSGAIWSPPIQSGIYGFSGAHSDLETNPEGVVGECVWIFDAMDKSQVAKGKCSERQPGKFRVVLKPGRYVVHGPGGNQKVEIKRGEWVKVTSIVLLPLGP